MITDDRNKRTGIMAAKLTDFSHCLLHVKHIYIIINTMRISPKNIVIALIPE